MHSLRFITIILLISILSILTGCKKPIISRVEIDKNFFVIASGVDVVSEENDTVKLTIVSEKVEVDSKMISDEKKAHIVTAEGKTTFEANRKFHLFTNRDIFLGHSQFILFSEEVAKENIMKYLDFYLRDHELRLTSNVLIVEGSTVEDFFMQTNSSQYFIGEKLENLASDVGAFSLSKEVTIYESIDALDNEYSSAYIPIICLIDKKSIDTNNSNKMDMKMEGYAIFKNFKMIGALHGNDARGLNWITNDIDSGVIVVKDSNNNDISLEIIGSNSKIKPRYNNDHLSVVIEINMNSNIVEQEGIEDIYNEEDIEKLKNQQEDTIELEVKNVIKYTQKNNVDIMGIGNAVFHKYPVRWEKELKDKWEFLFPQIDFNIEVKSKINRVYNIKQPIGAKK